MSNRPTARNRLTLALLWLIFYATFTLWLPPLLDDADSVHAEVAREMLLRHDWITLYANGIRYLEKAPILYWSMALSFRLFGVSTAAARLPIALTVLTLALLLEAFARRAFHSPKFPQQGSRASLYAGLIFLSSFGIFIFTRITIPDIDVCLWLTLAIYAFWTTETPSDPAGALSQSPPGPLIQSLWGAPSLAASSLRVGLFPCLIFSTACALNVLTKGLIGIVFPIAIVLLYLLLTRGASGTLRHLRQLHPLAGTLTFLTIAAPWHILIGLANPTQGHPASITFANHHWLVPLPTDGNVHGWFWFYFMNEHLLRYLNLRVPRDYDTVPLAIFWSLLLVWLLPWSAYLYPALKRIPYRKALQKLSSFRNAGGPASRLSPIDRTRLLLALWALTPLLFFSFSTRQEYYVLPALPALILLLAAYLAEDTQPSNVAAHSLHNIAANPLPKAEFPGPEAQSPGTGAPSLAASSLRMGSLRSHSNRVPATLGILGLIAAAACLVFILHTRPPAPDTDLATLLQQNPGDYALSFGHFLDLNAPALGLFRLPLLLTAAAFGLGLPAAYLLHRRRQPHAANLTTAASAFLFLLAAHLGLQTFAPVLSSKAFADIIAPQLHPNDLIVLHGEYESGSTLGFYLHRADLHIVEGRSSNLWYGSFFPDAPNIFETRASIAQKWPGPQRIFLWQDPSDHDRPPLQLPAPVYTLARSGGKELLSNQPNR